jgi:DNA-binding NarL/FixJ family response regulator
MTDEADDRAPRVALVVRSALLADAVSRSLESEGIVLVATLPATPGAVEALQNVSANVTLVEAGNTVAETAVLLRRIQHLTSIPMLVFGAPVADHELVELIEAGCCGCVPREASLRELVAAVRDVCCGRAECSPFLAALVSARIRELAHELTGDASSPSLTPREVEVLRLAARGLGNKEIAGELGVWLQTVKSHLHNAYEKLGVRTRRGAVTRALRLGLIRDTQAGE